MSNYIVIDNKKHQLVETKDPRYCLSCSLYRKCLVRRQFCTIFGGGPGLHFESSDI